MESIKLKLGEFPGFCLREMGKTYVDGCYNQ